MGCVAANLEATIFICSDCNRRYKNRESLSRHVKYECGKEPAFNCSYCSFRSKRKENLSCHVVAKHNDLNGFHISRRSMKEVMSDPVEEPTHRKFPCILSMLQMFEAV